MKRSMAMKLTMEAMRIALADAPETLTAWVPLRRVAVEEALRMLGNLETIVDAVRYLGHFDEEVPHEVNPVPVWRYPVLSAEEAAGQGENVAQFAEVTTARSNGNGNGAVTVAPTERLTYTQPARVAKPTPPAPEKPTNGWRRMPKEERLELVCAEIARQAGERTWLTQSEFDRDKPETMPSASGLAATLGVTWIGLVSQALLHAVVPAAQPGRPGRPPVAKETSAAPAAEPFREAAAED